MQLLVLHPCFEVETISPWPLIHSIFDPKKINQIILTYSLLPLVFHWPQSWLLSPAKAVLHYRSLTPILKQIKEKTCIALSLMYFAHAIFLEHEFKHITCIFVGAGLPSRHQWTEPWCLPKLRLKEKWLYACNQLWKTEEMSFSLMHTFADILSISS